MSVSGRDFRGWLQSKSGRSNGPRVLRGLVVVGLLVLVVGPPTQSSVSNFGTLAVEEILSIALITIGVNILMGYANQLSLGPGATFGVAGYTAALFASHFPSLASLWLMVLIGALAGFVTGLIVSAPALRVGGFYLANATLLFALLVPAVATNTPSLGGIDGIDLLGAPGFNQNPSGTVLYELTLGIVVLAVSMQYLLRYSRSGRVFLAVGNSDELCASMGRSPYLTKVGAFAIAAIPAGIGGALYAYTQELITPTSVAVTISLYVILAVIIGGIGRTWGPLFGTLVVFGLQIELGTYNEYADIILGVLLFIMVVKPPGIGAAVLQRLPLYRAAYTTQYERRKVRDTVTDIRRISGEPPSSVDNLLSESTPNPESVLETTENNPGSDGALIVSGVTKRFGGNVAVDHVDLIANPGRIHAILGPNGAGKTTVLNLLSGWIVPDEGEVLFAGQGVVGLRPYQCAALGFTRSFQTPKLLERSSVLENVMLGAEQPTGSGRPKYVADIFRFPSAREITRSARVYAQGLLAQLGLEGVTDTPAGQCPHGTRRMIEVARCLARRPRILLLDEPAAGLSPSELHGLGEVLVSAKRSGILILLIEHNVPFVMRIADDVTVMADGRVVSTGSPEAVMSHPEVIASYFGGSAMMQSVGHE
jgi:branched-chain amino acid transport system permease protein